MNDLISDYTTAMINLAYEKGIIFIGSDKFQSDTPSQAYPDLRKLIINLNWYDKLQIPYIIAHEIGHCENGDEGVLYFTPTKSRYEAAADRYAVDTLAPMYFEDISPEFANVHRFMDALHIPACMEDYCSEVITNFYAK